MATITITILESPLQKISGIPSNVTLETNIPATIFYTLDSTEPTIGSSVAIDSIDLPSTGTVVTLKAFATNGIDTSPTITETYSPNIVSARTPHDKVYDSGGSCSVKASYPFGSPAATIVQPYTYGNTAGITVDDNESPRIADGYDGTNTLTGTGYYTPPKSKYDFVFSETNAIGETGNGIGTLPGKVLYVEPTNDNTTVESTNAESAFFDPKALVIFQDSREESYDEDIPKINKPYFDLENPAKARDASLLTNIDTITTQGSFLRAHYNPKDNTLTYYYYDNRVGRWIISKEPYNPSTQNPTTNLAGIVSRPSDNKTAGMIFKWIPFKYRTLT